MAEEPLQLPVLAAGEVVFGRLRLLEALGGGGMGRVWAVSDATGTRLAIKFAAAGPAAEAALREGFEEARRLVHPGILRPLEWCSGPPAAVVMPCLDGVDLGSLRGAGWRDIAAALAEVAEALEHAHRHGVIHRDLKPSNVLRDGHGRWLLSDFGSSALKGAGTLPAMSPQQLDGEAAMPADDIYGLGALAWELLAGQPLFHPDITDARIHDESPQIPDRDLAGGRLPPALRTLLAAMLAKEAVARPPSAAAVHATLLAVLEDTAVAAKPVPVLKPQDALAPASAAKRGGLSAAAVYSALGLLLVVAVMVIVLLPRWAANNRAVPISAPQEVLAQAEEEATPERPAETVSQAELDEALGEFLRLEEELEKAGAERWAGEDWAVLRTQAGEADQAYRQREMASALEGYRKAAALAQALLASAPQILAEALAAGEAALQAEQREEAIRAFSRALAVDANDASARRGLARAERLDELLALMDDARAAEMAGRETEALARYRSAAALDPDWQAAREGVRRLSARLSQGTWEAQMAVGLAAQAAGRLESARTAFAAALAARPGDAAATAGLAEVEIARKLARLQALQTRAAELERAEDWAAALRVHEETLAIDSRLLEAREGVDRSRKRLDLDNQLRGAIADSGRFNDDAVLAKARATLDAAEAVTPQGPTLKGQLQELRHLVTVAQLPVPVVLQSDSLTEVTLFKVGRLGSFESRTMQLRPGLYTATGSRAGYRDVRRQFEVMADGPTQVIVVRCEEAI